MNLLEKIFRLFQKKSNEDRALEPIMKVKYMDDIECDLCGKVISNKKLMKIYSERINSTEHIIGDGNVGYYSKIDKNKKVDLRPIITHQLCKKCYNIKVKSKKI